MGTLKNYQGNENRAAAPKRPDVSHPRASLDDEAIGKLRDDILNPTSWRVSAPIRVFGRQFRKIVPQKESAKKSNVIQQLLESTSWRISAPIRILGRRFPNLAYAGRRFQELPEYISWRISTWILRRRLSAQRTHALVNSDSSIARFSLIQNNLRNRLILVGADIPPMFDRQSGALRLYTMMRILFEADWRMAFASQASRAQFEKLAESAANRERYERNLNKIGVNKIVYGYQEINAFLRSDGANIQCALLSFPHVANNLIPLITIHAPAARIIYDMVDFHYLRMVREADLKSNEDIRRSALRMREIELANARTSDVTIAVSEDEQQALLRLDRGIVVKVIPNIFEVSVDCDPGIATRKNLLFVGGFMHAPNIDAVVWFTKQVWPLIHQQRPNLRFIIAGSGPPPEVLALADIPGIEVTGYVEDLSPLFRSARVFVAPLRFGAGVKGKVGQSMAHGLPIVATKVAAEGMHAVSGKDLLVADEPAAFAAAVARLLDDDALWSQMQASGKRLIFETQSIEAARIKLGEIFNG